MAPEAEGQRLDRWLADQLPDHSRSRLGAWIAEGRVRVDGAAVKPSLRLRGGEAVTVEVPPPPEATTAQPVDFTVVYADDDVIVVDKPAGLVVHPGAGNLDQTLVNGLLHRFKTLSPVGAPDRPGIVHRIDAGTSGLLVVARTEVAHHRLAAQLAAHTMARRYHALAWDHGLPDAGRWDSLHARDPRDRRRYTGQAGHGKPATTHFEVLERVGPCAWLALRLETGRTHQIRVHAAEAGAPLVGDPVYGRRRRIEQPPALRQLGFELGLERQALHAATLGFVHPDGRTLFFESPIPPDIQAARDALSPA
ncbi:MAG: RluA family pseudouridine synthase [bacterium]